MAAREPKRDYYAGGVRIPKELKPPKFMDDTWILLAFLAYWIVILGVPVLFMTFGWFDSSW